MLKEIVIFNESHDEIDTILYLVGNNYLDHSITIVIPGRYNAIPLFKRLNEKLFQNKLNIVYFNIYYDKKRQGKLHRLLRIANVIGERQYLKQIYDKYLAGLEGAEVYFLTREFVPWTFYFLKRLRKRNKLIYMHWASYDWGVSEYTPENIFEWLKLLRMRFVYGYDMDMGKSHHVKGFSHIPDKFMKEEVDRVIDRDARNEIMKDFDFAAYNIFDTKDYRVIYIDQPLIGAGFVTDHDTYNKQMAVVFDILHKYYPKDKIAHKLYPVKYDLMHPASEIMVEVGIVVESYVPAEMLYNDNVEMYLSPFSTALANVEKGLAVSLADLITLRDEELRDDLKDILLQNSRIKVLFPKTLDEFEKILISIKEKVT